MSIDRILEELVHKDIDLDEVELEKSVISRAKQALYEELKDCVEDKGYDYWLSIITHADRELAEIQARAMEIVECQSNALWRERMKEMLI